jgi:hypothetical protein
MLVAIPGTVMTKALPQTRVRRSRPWLAEPARQARQGDGEIAVQTIAEVRRTIRNWISLSVLLLAFAATAVWGSVVVWRALHEGVIPLNPNRLIHSSRDPAAFAYQLFLFTAGSLVCGLIVLFFVVMKAIHLIREPATTRRLDAHLRFQAELEPEDNAANIAKPFPHGTQPAPAPPDNRG